MSRSLLEIQNLHVSVEEKEILTGFSLSVRLGEVHALMGKNGSGKSTLSYVLMGHPKYKVTQGSVYFEGEDLLQMSVDERARKGIFLAFQYPIALPGVTVNSFLRESCKEIWGEEATKKNFRKTVKSLLAKLQMTESIMTRYVHEGFSGGEKKRLEILQLLLLRPKLIILDETDSGLDVDALKTVTKELAEIRNAQTSFLIITHYQRMLDYIRPDRVHILAKGRVVREGDFTLAENLDRAGYEAVTNTLH